MRGKTKVVGLTHERVREVLDYNPATGVFVWKISPAKNVKAGSVAGGKRGKRGGKGYGYVVIDGEAVTYPRLAWFYMKGEWPERRVRMINGDPLDIRYDNLTLFNGIGGEFDFKSPTGKTEYLRAYRKASPHIEKARSLRESFGITLQEYGDMLLAQDGKCAICGQPETQMRGGKVKALAVDHCHTTGKVRGLLCVDCNQAIGKLKEDRDILLSAIRYLDKHKDASNVTPFERAS